MDTRRLGTRRDPVALTLLRVVAGVTMAAHGWQKVEGFDGWRDTVASMGVPAADVLAALAVAGELGGGIGLALGLLTPLSALGVLAVMIVATTAVHLPNGFFAQDGGFEYPLLMATVALFFLLRGPGPYSVDAMVRGRARHRREPERGAPYREPIGRPA
ncbi:DoxX family protein [Sandaracinus amylolyticus]|nr:DoxX family protein [Sandaracinus amylolyticus]